MIRLVSAVGLFSVPVFLWIIRSVWHPDLSLLIVLLYSLIAYVFMFLVPFGTGGTSLIEMLAVAVIVSGILIAALFALGDAGASDTWIFLLKALLVGLWSLPIVMVSAAGMGWTDEDPDEATVKNAGPSPAEQALIAKSLRRRERKLMKKKKK